MPVIRWLSKDSWAEKLAFSISILCNRFQRSEETDMKHSFGVHCFMEKNCLESLDESKCYKLYSFMLEETFILHEGN